MMSSCSRFSLGEQKRCSIRDSRVVKGRGRIAPARKVWGVMGRSCGEELCLTGGVHEVEAN